MNVLQLLLRYMARAAAHETLALLILREGNDITDAGATREQCDETLNTERYAAVRRCAVGECLEHVAEAAFDNILRNLEDVFKDALLNFGLMDTNTTACDFPAIENTVIMLPADSLWIGVEKRDIFRNGRRKGMVSGNVAAFFFIIDHERELNDPEEVVLLFVENETLTFNEELSALQTDTAKDGASAVPIHSGKEYAVAVFDIEAGLESGLFFLAEELQDGALPFAILCLDEGEALGTEHLGGVFEGFHFALRGVGKALSVESLYNATLSNDVCENLKASVFEDIAEIYELQTETGVRLIHTEAVHGFVVRHTGEGQRNINALHFFPDGGEHAFHEGIHVLTINEGCLDIYLGELGLAVSAKVFVTEAASHLVVALYAGNHEHLLELLGRLRKRVKLTRVDAAGHEELAGAFGGALKEVGGFDFEEALAMEVVAGGTQSDGASADGIIHRRTAQVQIAIGKAQVLVDALGLLVVEREGRRLGNIVNDEFGSVELNLARLHGGIDRLRGARGNRAGDLDDRLGLQSGKLVLVRSIIGIKNNLCKALAVAKVQKYDPPVVAQGINPPDKGYALADMVFGEFTAVVRTHHGF